MNRKTFEHYMKREPADVEHSYLFLVDNKDLALNIAAVGFPTTAIVNEDGFFNTDQLMEYLSEIAFKGTCRSDYIYVLACSSKKINDMLAQFFTNESLKYREGWQLFWKKGYLEKIEQADGGSLLQITLNNYIASYEKPPEFPVEYYKFHEIDAKGKPGKVIDMNIVDDILEKVSFVVLAEVPFIYENGRYFKDNLGIHLKEMIQKRILREKINAPTINRVYQLLITQSGVQREFSDMNRYPAYWVNFQNGFFDPIEWKMIPHDKKYLALNQIPHEFDPEKEINEGDYPIIGNYLEWSIADPDEREMMWEYLGYSMTRDTKFQKFLMLLGNGGTGKSVLIDLFQNVIGKENSSHISLQDLNKRFYATNLFGKLLNSCGDIPCKSMEQTDIIKKATGEDMLMFERKQKDPHYFMSYAKLLFSANDMPENLEEKSDAFYRRIMILDMNRPIPADKKDPKLKQKMEKEITYSIHMAMKALARLYSQDHFTESEHSKECVEDIQCSSDSVKAFLRDKVIRMKGLKLEKSVMYRMYDNYCTDSGRTPLGKKRFFSIMERKGYSCRKSNGIYYFFDVTEKPEDFEPVDDMTIIPFD